MKTRNTLFIAIVALSGLIATAANAAMDSGMGANHQQNQNISTEQHQQIQQIRNQNLDPATHRNAVHNVLTADQKQAHQTMMGNHQCGHNMNKCHHQRHSMNKARLQNQPTTANNQQNQGQNRPMTGNQNQPTNRTTN